MSNVLSEEKKQQVIALGMLGWPLRRIEKFTGVRRETAGAYLKAAGIAVRPPGAWGRRAPAKPANGVTTDPVTSKPANEVTTDFSPPISPPTNNQDRVSSACEPFRELIEQGLGRGRNAMAIWQDLVSDQGFPHGYQTVKRFCSQARIGVATSHGDLLTASSTTATSSNAGRGAGGPSCRRNNEHRAENQPESHDLNYGRPRENAATGPVKEIFFERRGGNGPPPRNSGRRPL